jgi:hypothetical protein
MTEQLPPRFTRWAIAARYAWASPATVAVERA